MKHEGSDVDLLWITLQHLNVAISALNLLCHYTEIKDCRQKLVNYKDVSFYIKRLIAFHGRDVRLDDKVDHLQLSAQLQTITELIKANKTQEANRSIGSFEKQITQFFSIMSSSKNAELRDLSSFYFKPPYGTELIYPKYEQVNK
jgi:hypothetical protein